MGAADAKLYVIKFLCEGLERSFVLRKGAVVPVKLHFPGSADIVNGNVANVGTVIPAGMLRAERNTHLVFHQIPVKLIGAGSGIGKRHAIGNKEFDKPLILGRTLHGQKQSLPL